MEQTSKKRTSKPFSPEFRERAVRLAMESFAEWAVELRLSKIRRRLLQYLVRLPQFTVLALKLFDPQFLRSRLTRSLATITLDLSHPNAKAVRRTAQFARDRRQRRSFALILIAVLPSLRKAESQIVSPRVV
jgi:hypothetical protein